MEIICYLSIKWENSRLFPGKFPLASRWIPAGFPLASRWIPAAIPLDSRWRPGGVPVVGREPVIRQLDKLAHEYLLA
jgi:hypothetical protein